MIINMSGTLPRGLRENRIRMAIRETFRVARRVERGSVAVRFVSEAEIAKLNRAYCGASKPTDVLSFPAVQSAEEGKEWGDIIIASSYAKREAARRDVPFHEEMIRLVSHGMLHLFGYDHRTKKEEAVMFGLQERVVKRKTYNV